MTGGRVHTVYTVTVKHPGESALARYVIAAPTPQHAVTAVERSTGGRAYVWQVDAPVSGDQWQRKVIE